VEADVSDLKATCPGCDSSTSSIRIAFREGHPCPVCGLPAHAAREIDAARARGADAKLTARLAKLEAELADAKDRAHTAEYKLEQIKGALEGRL
jgi:DNA repair exonuclease SbcCD ATPase subunit